ncbi:MAG TPA: carboxy terminal-processing peptidase, partial [Deltaproteobacteria bacterium]|nr:carboxy terminal-processing peptidase [Deltaproteobacteria bacterium]
LYDRDPRIFYSGPLAVVVNRLSASASEIFAGAMQDYGRAVIIGEDTFGKGTVQTLMDLDRGQLKLTSAKFYRISGASTQHKGIIPDIEYPSMYDKVKIGEDAYEEALPWDTISGVPHEKHMDLTTFIPQLKRMHLHRITDNADYLYLLSMLDYLKTQRQKQHLSLNRSRREQENITSEKRRLELENMRRQARGLPLLEALEDDGERGNEEDDRASQDDPVLIESGNILVDLLTLINQPPVDEPVVRAHQILPDQ